MILLDAMKSRYWKLYLTLLPTLLQYGWALPERIDNECLEDFLSIYSRSFLNEIILK